MHLADLSGNRRFWVVKINSKNEIPNFNFSQEYKDQIQAEAKHCFVNGEPLFFNGEYLKAAKEYQNNAMEYDDRVGIVEKYLNTLLPDNWDELSLHDRHLFFRINPNNIDDHYEQTVGSTIKERLEVSGP